MADGRIFGLANVVRRIEHPSCDLCGRPHGKYRLWCEFFTALVRREPWWQGWTPNDAADDGKTPQNDWVEIACCSEEDMQRCLSSSYRKKHGSSTPFGFCVLAGGAVEE
ncbi:uncharacterized protein LAESUDRAFT_761208 [Laetiporus sulphureus 93-53]|uniref:Uncharacterized protein n=1 Tax=Laetiporus sulphureus 93-53 TaxID=1314785 RepID=A0A165D9D4_9APHY|nr:uncharacterized protein LAESUDRAFT_761208 [Laetiporus sulphureus 93-53]KZT04375.1 hypothetical protein LAESUDRAFT_761208 [Laetiporus sulphureus 93-53]